MAWKSGREELGVGWSGAVSKRDMWGQMKSVWVGALLLAAMAAMAQEVAIVHVTVINPGKGKGQADMTIVTHGQRIMTVGRAREVKVPASAQVVEGKGKYVIPGLWDMHTHFRDPKRDLEMYVANGVLGIRNMGGPASEVFPLRQAIAEGRQLGPKIVASGPIVDGPDSSASPSLTVSVKTPEEARATIRSLKREGADLIKVYDQLTRDEYRAIADEARKQGIPFAGHIPGTISVREASEAGQLTVEHGMMLGGGCTAEDQYMRLRTSQEVFQEAMRTKNFSLIPAKIARDETFLLDHFSQQRADATYALLARNHTYITPTLVTQRSLTFVDELSKQDDPRMRYVSADDLSWWKPEKGMLTRYRTPEYIAMRKRQYAKTMEEIPRAVAQGVRLLAGTDITIPFTYPGFSLHDELKLFVQAGLTPMQALETATTNPAAALGLEKTWGRVAAGYSANFVVLTADPLADIGNTEKIDAVVVQGKLLQRAELDKTLEEAKVR